MERGENSRRLGRAHGKVELPRYFAQGGDWGAVVTSHIGRRDPEHCLGIHLNMVTVPPDPSASDLTEIELSALAGWQFYQESDSGLFQTTSNATTDPWLRLSGFSQRTGRLDC